MPPDESPENTGVSFDQVSARKYACGVCVSCGRIFDESGAQRNGAGCPVKGPSSKVSGVRKTTAEPRAIRCASSENACEALLPGCLPEATMSSRAVCVGASD